MVFITEASKDLIAQEKHIIGCNIHGVLVKNFSAWEPHGRAWARRFNDSHFAFNIACFMSHAAAIAIKKNNTAQRPYIIYYDQDQHMVKKAYAAEPLVFPEYRPPHSRGGLSVVTGVLRLTVPYLDDFFRYVTVSICISLHNDNYFLVPGIICWMTMVLCMLRSFTYMLLTIQHTAWR